MPPEFLTRYAGFFLDVHVFPPKRHSNFQSVGINRASFGRNRALLKDYLPRRPEVGPVLAEAGPY